MKILVCGGRDYKRRSRVYDVLDRIDAEKGITLIIQGAAMGADALAQDWAISRQIPYVGVPAKWQKHGKNAGPIRNSEMLDEWNPDAVVAFEGGDGTADMVSKAKKANVPVWEIVDSDAD